MEQSLKMLVLAAGLIMTLSLISLSMYTFREGKKMAADFNRALTEEVKEQEEYEYTKYEDGNITGGEVISAITALQKKVSITVNNGGNVITYRGAFTKEGNKPGNAGYVALSYIYKGSVRRDAKGVINEIVFTKK